MALKATIFRVELSIANIDRGYYADHSLTIPPRLLNDLIRRPVEVQRINVAAFDNRATWLANLLASDRL